MRPCPQLRLRLRVQRMMGAIVWLEACIVGPGSGLMRAYMSRRRMWLRQRSSSRAQLSLVQPAVKRSTQLAAATVVRLRRNRQHQHRPSHNYSMPGDSRANGPIHLLP